MPFDKFVCHLPNLYAILQIFLIKSTRYKFRRATHNTFLQKNATYNMLVKLTLVANFTNIFMQSFYARRFQKCKKTVRSLVSFLFLGYTYAKSCM